MIAPVDGDPRDLAHHSAYGYVTCHHHVEPRDVRQQLDAAIREEIGRTPLIKPTSDPRGRFRKLGAVFWSHPAYANKHIYARNDEELIASRLAADDYR